MEIKINEISTLFSQFLEKKVQNTRDSYIRYANEFLNLLREKNIIIKGKNGEEYIKLDEITKEVLEEAYLNGQNSEENEGKIALIEMYTEVKSKIETGHQKPKKEPTPLTDEQLKRIQKYFDKQFELKGSFYLELSREFLIFNLFLRLGLKIPEVINIRMRDFECNANGDIACVHVGTGKSERILDVSENLRRSIKDYLMHRRTIVSFTDNLLLDFDTEKASGYRAIEGCKMTSKRISEIIESLNKKIFGKEEILGVLELQETVRKKLFESGYSPEMIARFLGTSVKDEYDSQKKYINISEEPRIHIGVDYGDE